MHRLTVLAECPNTGVSALLNSRQQTFIIASPPRMNSSDRLFSVVRFAPTTLCPVGNNTFKQIHSLFSPTKLVSITTQTTQNFSFPRNHFTHQNFINYSSWAPQRPGRFWKQTSQRHQRVIRNLSGGEEVILMLNRKMMTTASDNETWPKLRNCCDKLCFSVVRDSLRFLDGKLTLLKSSMTEALSLYTALCRRAGGWTLCVPMSLIITLCWTLPVEQEGNFC